MLAHKQSFHCASVL